MKIQIKKWVVGNKNSTLLCDTLLEVELELKLNQLVMASQECDIYWVYCFFKIFSKVEKVIINYMPSKRDPRLAP